MTLNSSGPISLAGSTTGQSIALELGLSATASISLNTAAVRTLAGVPSGAITMPTNFYGKSNRVSISYTFTTNTQNASLAMSSIGGYVSGASDITITVNSGIYLWASTTGNYGLNLTGGASGDTVTVVNTGYIMGCGGGSNAGNTGGAVGGPALNVGIASNITINNTNASAYIGGGGGQGGLVNSIRGGGGGAGGGQGGSSDYCTGPGFRGLGGTGGAIGVSGSNGTQGCACGCKNNGGGGGGRIFPGTGGNAGKGGSAGGGGAYGNTAAGGAGGSSNNAGSAGTNGNTGGGGGGWGASGGSGGGAGGKAVNLNGKSVTWTSGNTTRVYGAVS